MADGSSEGRHPHHPVGVTRADQPVNLDLELADGLGHGQCVAEIAVLVLPGGADRAWAGELPAFDGLRPARERCHS